MGKKWQVTAGPQAARRAAGGTRAAPIELIAEHRFRARYRAELARRPRRVVAAALVTVVGPLGYLTLGIGSGATPALPRVTPIVAAAPLGASAAAVPDQVDDDPWVAHARLAAATCPGLPASVLLAIGTVETGHGQVVGPSSAGAWGPMQFLPATWVAYGADGDGDGSADIMNAADAVLGAARLLCANGGADPARLRSALWNYNHSAAYVDQVLAVAGIS